MPRDTCPGGLRTADGVSEVVTAGQVFGSIIMFGLVYVLLFALWVFLLDRAIRKGPDDARSCRVSRPAVRWRPSPRGPRTSDTNGDDGRGGR